MLLMAITHRKGGPNETGPPTAGNIRMRIGNDAIMDETVEGRMTIRISDAAWT